MRLASTTAACVLSAVCASSGAAQISVNPNGVNVNTQGASTVFLTFGGVAGYQAIEALWCGELIDAAPDVGLRCDPATIFGSLPVRYDRSTGSGTGALTDIMTIPPSVTRRAYQAAEAGTPSAFYYVRRFRSLAGGPDQYVVVTCRLAGGGARVPLSLTDVRIAFEPDIPVLQIAPDEILPRIEAEISYTGTGRLAGRWEIVLPGETPPSQEDLLTEATLPLERRGTQRRYTQLSRFNVFLPPTGRVVLPGPEPDRLPTTADGVYHILLRIEATSDKEADSNLGAVGAGTGIVPAGAVAGFPMPVLSYVVGSGQSLPVDEPVTRDAVMLLFPRPRAEVAPDSTFFTWQHIERASIYRIELETADGEPLLSAVLPATRTLYRAPPWLGEQAGAVAFRWRVTATDEGGRAIARSAWRTATFAPRDP